VSSAWIVVLGVGLATIAIKAAGPVLLGGRPLPRRLTGVVSLAGPALLAALVAIDTFGADRSLRLDERVIGVGVAAVAIVLRAPVLVVVVAAAASTAIARAFA
jgi:branched-subunit amino acid transport protein